MIDADAFRDFWNKNYRHQYANDMFLFALANFPTVDAVEVVRCKDCKHYVKDSFFCRMNCLDIHEHSVWYEDDFCSYGERRADVET